MSEPSELVFFNWKPIEGANAELNDALRQIDDSLRWLFERSPAGGGAPLITDLDDLLDVTIATPLDSELLQYNGISSQWENTDLSALALILDDLLDVTITAPRKEETLVYDGSQWINVKPEDLTFTYTGNNLTGIDGATTDIDITYSANKIATLDDQTDTYTYNYTGNRLTSVTVAPS